MFTQANKDSWGRMGVLALALVNQVLTISGKNPLTVSDSDTYLLFTMLFTAGAAIWGFWKNNNFTKHAVQAQAYQDSLKLQSSMATSTDTKPADPASTPLAELQKGEDNHG